MSPIRLMLADDHKIVRAGLRMLLGTQPDMEVVAEASSGAQAVELAQAHQPDVILMDIAMPDMNGMEATHQIKIHCPSVAVLALTIHEGEDYFFRMLDAGALGFIPKRAAPDED